MTEWERIQVLNEMHLERHGTPIPAKMLRFWMPIAMKRALRAKRRQEEAAQWLR